MIIQRDKIETGKGNQREIKLPREPKKSVYLEKGGDRSVWLQDSGRVSRGLLQGGSPCDSP